MIKRVLTVLLFLVAVISGAFADDLLRHSIQSCTHDELVAMCMAYNLDPTLSDEFLRSELFAYFNLPDEAEVSFDYEPEKATSIGIDHADQLFTSDDVIILSGNVRISFTTDDGTRSLVAENVAVDLNSKVLQATGAVELGGTDEKERVFTGSVVSLDWSNLDVIVYEGTSSTTRTNTSGTSIVFYVAGETVSYAGPTSGILFRNGTIATTELDPYWSISANKLSLSERDLFVDRAVFRLGRVPIFYFPIFFYPGTTLSFNPAIGLSSDKGAFLTTTYELYGIYPKLGVMGTKSKSDSDSSGSSEDDPDYAGAITSFLATEDDTEMIHDGFYYRPVKEGEDLGELESWARDTNSYFAVFADVYENMGLVAGIDTLNHLLDRSLSLGAVGAAGYMANQVAGLPRFRYTFDFDMSYKKGGLNVSAKLPLLSDPYVRRDFLNRNTSFALDALLGSEQFFPNSYSTMSTYTWVVNASYSKKVGNFSFNLSSLKADIDYKLVTDKNELNETFYKSEIVEGSLPYLSFTSNGTFLSLQGKNRETTRTLDYTSDLAQDFNDERLSIELPEKEIQEEVTEGSDDAQTDIQPDPEPLFKYYGGPALSLEEKTVSKAGSIKAGYTFSQSLDNIYKAELEHDNIYTKGSGSVYVSASAPGQWFDVTETIKPQFNFSRNENGTSVDELYLTSELKAGVPKAGVTYNLTQKVYNHYIKVTETTTDTTDRWGEWDKTDVTVHNLNFSKKIGSFTLGFYFQLRPLTEIIKPSLAYTRGPFKVSADFSMKRPPDTEEFKKDVANLNLSYTESVFTFSLANKYDFTKVEGDDVDYWNGYSLTQKASLKPVKGLTLNQSSSYKNRFEATKFQVGAAYVLDTSVLDLNASASMSFKDREYDKDILNIGLKLSQDKLTFWKGRMGVDSSLNFAFNYDFQNPYRTSFTVSYTFEFGIAEFMDLAISVSSANKTFARYYQGGSFNFSSMLEDLWRSFDFFGEGRVNTGFNLNAFRIQMVHYMRDWNLYIDAQGQLTTKYSGKYEWVPTVTVYIKWNAIPELKTQGYWDSNSNEWT